MREEILVLERNLQSDLDAIDGIYERLGDRIVARDAAEETLIVKAYLLHNLYNACENMFRGIAAVFENQVDDDTGWHSQLLKRMRLDLTPLRPAVIGDEAYEKLDELRRFRHFFRTAYGVPLDAERFSIAQRKALELRKPLNDEIAAFLRFLAELQEARE